MTQATGPEETERSPASPATSELVGIIPFVQGDSVGLEGSETIQVLEEIAALSKRRVVHGKVRVATRTETYEQQAEVTLDKNVVEVTRVPVGRKIEVAPPVRTVGDTTIVPVVEERLVTIKQLFLVEELHVRHRTEQETARETISLRRQHVTVERFDAEGRLITVENPA